MGAIERKLRHEILPYLITAEHLRRWRPLRIYTFYVYAGEVFVLLAGLGIATPITRALADGKGSTSTGYSQLLDVLGSGYMAAASIALLLIWGLLKFYVRTEDLPKRCNLLKSSIRQCSQLSFQVKQAVAKPDPMPSLISIQDKLSYLIDRSIAEDAWPDPVFPDIDHEVDKYLTGLIAPHKANWQQFDSDERPTARRRRPLDEGGVDARR